MEQAQNSQVDWLGHDCKVLVVAIRTRPAALAKAFAEGSPDQLNYHRTVLSMFWCALDHANGAQVLIESGLRAPLAAVQRSLLELTAGVRYLVQGADPVLEAAIKQAYEIQQEVQEGHVDGEALAERQDILKRMPSTAVQEAAARLKARRGWTGKSARKILEIAGMGDYSVYAHLSEEAHGSLTQYQASRIMIDGKPHIRLGRAFIPLEAEFSANFSRRVLFLAYEALATAFPAFGKDFQTSDPYAWLERQE